MYKYNSDSQVALYIQHLLRTTPIPQCASVNPYNKELIKGELIEGELIGGCPDLTYLDNRHFYRNSSDGAATAKFRWEFGEAIPNITSTFGANQSYYSTEVHERLGDYLRAYRDYYGIDLMNFYNCYSNRLFENIKLPIKDVATQEDSSQLVTSAVWWKSSGTIGSKSTCFPIKVGATYHIKIYSKVSGEVKLQPLFCQDGRPMRVTLKLSSENKYLLTQEAAKYGHSSDFYFTASLENLLSKDGLAEAARAKQKLFSKQRYLNLFVQVPGSDDLRMTVIEQTGYPAALNNSLLHLNTIDYNVPFSDRLLEYLTGNVITSADPIPRNIEQIQRIVSSTDFERAFGVRYEQPYTKGGFSESLRRFLYSTFFDYVPSQSATLGDDGNYTLKANKLEDFLGYVDRDVEKLLWGCLSAEFRQELMEG